MSRKLTILILLAGLYASRSEAQAEKLGIVVEIHSPKLQTIIYPGTIATDVAVATAEQLKVQFTGDERQKIDPRPPLDQWELVPMAHPLKGRKVPTPPNRLVFSIDEINQAMWLKLRFFSANGAVGQVSAQWRQPGDSSGYPAAASAGKAFAALFTSKLIDEQSSAVNEKLRHIPLASGKWTTSGIQIPLPLPAERHEQLRSSYFRLYGEWQNDPKPCDESGDMQVFADGMSKAAKSRYWSYDALAAKWNDHESKAPYQKYARCMNHLQFLAVYLAQYRIPNTPKSGK